MPYPSASSDPVPCPPALHCGTTLSLESPFHCNCRVATRSRRNGLPPMTPTAIKRVNLTPNIVSRCQVEKTRLRPRKRVQLTAWEACKTARRHGEFWWRRREYKVHKKLKLWNPWDALENGSWICQMFQTWLLITIYVGYYPSSKMRPILDGC